MEPKTLSSYDTFVLKFITPIFAGLISVAFCLLAWAGTIRGLNHEIIPPRTNWITGVLLLLAAAATLRGVILKRVRMDSEQLYISNYLKEIAVSIANIEQVQEGFGLRVPRITLRFCTRTEFGDKIVFIPEGTIFGDSPQPHPVVKEITQLIQLSNPKGHRFDDA